MKGIIAIHLVFSHIVRVNESDDNCLLDNVTPVLDNDQLRTF